MEKDNSINPLNQTVIDDTVSISEQPKTNNFLTILLSVLLFVAVAIAGFFALQTQKLVKELTLLRTESTPAATSEPTVEPVATESSEIDSNLDWMTYKDKYFVIQYPDSMKAANSSLDQLSKDSNMNINESFENIYHTTPPVILSAMKITSNDFNVSAYVFENKNNLSSVQWADMNGYYPEHSDKTINNVVYIDGIKSTMGIPDTSMFYSEAYLIPSLDKMTLLYTHPMDKKELFGQILSTFKFLD
jgi:hypothetical protein